MRVRSGLFCTVPSRLFRTFEVGGLQSERRIFPYGALQEHQSPSSRSHRRSLAQSGERRGAEGDGGPILLVNQSERANASRCLMLCNRIGHLLQQGHV